MDSQAKDALLAKLSTRELGSSTSRVGVIGSEGDRRGETWERAQTDTCPHLETTNSSSIIVEFTPKDTKYLTEHGDGGLGQTQPLPISMKRSTEETSWTYKGQMCCEGIWR